MVNACKSATNTGGNHLISIGCNDFFRVALDKGNSSIWVYMKYSGGTTSVTYGADYFPVNEWIHITVTFNNGIVSKLSQL